MSKERKPLSFWIRQASQNGMPSVISFDESIDITQEVIDRINADAPPAEEEARSNHFPISENPVLTRQGFLFPKSLNGEGFFYPLFERNHASRS